MKKILMLITAIILVGVLSVTAFTSTPPTWQDVGEQDTTWHNNTAGDSYTISTAKQLAGLAKLVNEGNDFAGKTINLANSIDLSGKQWVPIGTSANKFNGTFDGMNKEITGIDIEMSADYVGLFAYTDTASQISNLGIKGTVNATEYQSTAGGIVGHNKGAINDCYNAATVMTTGGKNASGNYCSSYAGGIAGTNDGTITDCFNKGIVKANKEQSCAGGIAVENNGTITGCYNEGTVSGSNSGAYLSGIVEKNNGTITGCYNKGTLSASANGARINGIARINNGTIKNCYNASDLSSSYASSTLSGITVINYGAITDCFNTGDFSVTAELPSVSGIVRENRANGTIENCYNTGDLSVSGSLSNASGIAKVNESSTAIKNCYNAGTISATGNYSDSVAILMESEDALIENCYYKNGSSGVAVGKDGNGNPVADRDLTNVGTYTNATDDADLLGKMVAACGEGSWLRGKNTQITTKALFAAFPDMFDPNPNPDPTPKADNSPPSPAELEYKYFTENGTAKIKDAKAGDIIIIDAKYYTELPSSMIDTLYGKEVTLIIKKDGKEISLHGSKVPAPSKSRAFYPIEYLMGL